jgi:hypothetical protein
MRRQGSELDDVHAAPQGTTAAQTSEAEQLASCTTQAIYVQQLWQCPGTCTQAQHTQTHGCFCIAAAPAANIPCIDHTTPRCHLPIQQKGRIQTTHAQPATHTGTRGPHTERKQKQHTQASPPTTPLWLETLLHVQCIDKPTYEGNDYLPETQSAGRARRSKLGQASNPSTAPAPKRQQHQPKLIQWSTIAELA